jgi:hypothetical protein
MIDEALEMLNVLKNGRKIPESEIAEMVDNLTSRAKDLEHEVEVSHLEAVEEKECWRIAGELENYM